jgi:hypothetical protein
MPYYGYKKFICIRCGKTYYQWAGDVLHIWQLMCPEWRRTDLKIKWRAIGEEYGVNGKMDKAAREWITLQWFIVTVVS